jgi:ADP-ribosyl-[dinitrogen reductase] hydrolase
MHSTHLRKDSIHGLLIGAAVGDALGFPREGLKRRAALKMFGRPPLKFRLVPGFGIYSDDTQLLLITAQSMIQSLSELKFFRQVFMGRLAWYSVSLPVGLGRATLFAGLKRWLRYFRVSTGCKSAGNGPAVRAIFMALALHGTEHRLNRWVEEGTRLTHDDALAVECCQVLAKLSETAAVSRGKPLAKMEVLDALVAMSKIEGLRQKLMDLKPFLERGRSPRAVARHFGWQKGISGYILPTTITSCYCFLRYPDDFRRAIESSIMLGGDTDSVAAIVGGLVGGRIGFSKLPTELVNKINDMPHDRQWIADMADRLSHWPHGADDLHTAPALPSEPLLQVVRNLMLIPVLLLHLLLRLPFWFVR